MSHLAPPPDFAIGWFDPDRVALACDEAGDSLKGRCPASINPRVLMRALAEVESSFGSNCVPRHEPAYDLGGKLYRAQTPGGEGLRQMRRDWGAWAACSYGAWQVMFPVARELGFHVTPIKLCGLAESSSVAAALLRKRIFREVSPGSSTGEALRVIGDSYNSGTSRDAFVPNDYIVKLTAAYRKHDRNGNGNGK